MSVKSSNMDPTVVFSFSVRNFTNGPDPNRCGPEDRRLWFAAGVNATLQDRFSSQGPVRWARNIIRMEWFRNLRLRNQDLPCQLPDGKVIEVQINGNSFAGPMFCGTIALMLSADPDLMPWDCREIIIQTATDVGESGYDYQTGHGLINCYTAVREVLRRKALREGNTASQFASASPAIQLNTCMTRSPDKPATVIAVAPRRLLPRA